MSLHSHWTWEFDVPREALWRYLADTDWVNEHAGLPKITPRFEPLPHGGTRKFGSFRQGPLTFEWEERPTQWQVPEFFAVDRLYSRGLLKRFVNRTALEDLGEGRTRVVVDVDLQAASPLLDPLLPLLAAHGKRGADKAFRLAAALAADDGAPQTDRVENEVFAPLRAAGVDPKVVAAISGFVDTAEDRDLLHIRPYELAARWNLPRREVLRGFLAATRAGLFNLRWNVICPSCRGPSPGIDSLGELQKGYHCPACNVPFDAVFDRSVEVTFDARPLGKRKIEEGFFCLASPQRSAHVFAQYAIAPGEVESFELDLPAGSYDFNVIATSLVPFTVEAGAGERALRTTVREDAPLELPHALEPGTLRFEVTNALDREIVIRVEEGRWPDTIATAAHVTALQEFRDLFSSEVLAPGLELGIETMAILFTDLFGSTAMYSKTGDAPAFRIVTDHFDVVEGIVARHEGTIVKTIGDAVMAAFADPVQALGAALELDEGVRTISVDGEPLRLRVGFHVGPCIAMRANERIDYFGTTVNLAARLQSLAGVGEVTLAASVLARPAFAAALDALHLPVGRESRPIKGFPDPVDILRITCVP